MRASLRAALVAAVVLILASCTQPNQLATNSPEVSPSPSPIGTPVGTAPSPSSAKLIIRTLPFHLGEVGVTYGPVTLVAQGGVPPYTWSIGGGTFPPGLALSPAGTATGTAGTAGKFSFVVKVADSAGGTDTKSAGVTVYSALSVTQLCLSKCVIGAGCTRCGAFGAVSHGLAPYRYAIAGGAVPRGMTLSGLSLKGGFPVGAYGLSIQVTDQLGVQATVGANWSIYGPATLSKGGDCVDTQNYPPFCNLRWTYSGGNPTAVPKVVILGYSQNCNVQGVCETPTVPPPGWKVSVTKGVVNISASGSGCVTHYIGTVRLALVDTAKCATSSRSNEQDLKVDLEYSC